MADHPVILIGGGGHAGVVLDVCIASGVRVAGVLDDNADCPLADALPYLGPLDAAIPEEARALVALGNLDARQRVIDRLDPDRAAEAIVHPSATVSPSATLGRGAVLMPGAVVNRDARVGDHAIVNTRAVVEHDCVVGANTHIAPGAVLGGGASVDRRTLVGLQSGVLPGMRIGARCVIGAGAIVTGDIEDGTTAAGVPARAIATPVG
ncbi:MAG: acetyltransferase [Planctomycetota bacterium]